MVLEKGLITLFQGTELFIGELDGVVRTKIFFIFMQLS